MKVFDCFQFFDENMMLDLRLNILDKYVDHFVIVENLYMHNGKPKKQNFQIDNFKKFENKIEYILLDELPNDLNKIEKNSKENGKIIDNALKIEKKQRNMIAQGLKKANDEDLIFFSDVDEIPDLENFKYKNKITVFKQKMMYYKFNLIYPNYTWMGTKVCKKKDFKSAEWLRNIKTKKYQWWRLDTFLSEKKFIDINFIENGGWHFTNVKNAQDIDFKMRNYAHHLEYEKSGIDLEKLKSNINKKTVFYNHFADKNSADKHDFEMKLEKAELKDLPLYINKNIDKYREWLD
jgi:beta-1,4-mannosyl-glycoprotein beta-1,4-N-acetylglucosaminyltransferase